MKHVFVLLVCAFFLTSCNEKAAAQHDTTSVFHSTWWLNSSWIHYQHNDRALYRILSDEAFRILEEREKTIAGLTSPQAWEMYRMDLKRKIFGSVDRFEKTPLNARITGTLEREDVMVEKILYESHPGFYVSACLFMPVERREPAPAVIYCSGHTQEGFRSLKYQRVILNLVEKGFIVFAFDPIGQGERLQYMNRETGEFVFREESPTREHDYAGVQTLLAGTSIADYFIWDGVRAIDYLLTRREVDPKRIGITGRSGGGTQSAMISAYDDRIWASAPECYITKYKRLYQSIGVADAEQNLYRALIRGFDHGDYFHLRAPKPSLIVTTTHDFFSIQGAREVFEEAQRSYAAFGRPDRIRFIEDLGIHESTEKNREAVYAFFQEFLELPGDPSDKDIEEFSLSELQVTPTGQILTSFPGAETVFSLNKRFFSPVNVPEAALPGKIMELSGADFTRTLQAGVFTGVFRKENILVEKYFLENDRMDYALPVYVAGEDRNSRLQSTEDVRIMVIFHPHGKAKAFEHPLLEKFIDSGYLVVSADLPGTGELENNNQAGDAPLKELPFSYTFAANLCGMSIPGIQAGSIDLLNQFIAREFRPGSGSMDALIIGESKSAFLHYAVFRSEFSRIAFLSPPPPAGELLDREFYNARSAYNRVPGALPVYDFDTMESLLRGDSFRTFSIQGETSPADNLDRVHQELLEFFTKE